MWFPLAIKSCSHPCPHLPGSHSCTWPLQISTFVHFLFIFSVVLERLALNIKCVIIIVMGKSEEGGRGAEGAVICKGPHFLQANPPHYRRASHCSFIESFIHLLYLYLLSVAGLKRQPEWQPGGTLRAIWVHAVLRHTNPRLDGICL